MCVSNHLLDRRDGQMALDKYRKQADPFITPVAMKLKNVSPNTISWIGLFLALLAGILFFYSGFEGEKNYYFLLAGAVVVLVSGYFDALDGKVARIWGKCSKKGDYLDHVFDRYADIFIIGGIAISEWCNPYWSIAAFIGVLMTSYMGTQAQAIGAPRLYAGILGRTDRLIFCTVFPIIQFISVQCFDTYYPLDFEMLGHEFTITWVEFLVIYFAIVGNITALERGVITWRNMSKQEDVFGVQKSEAHDQPIKDPMIFKEEAPAEEEKPEEASEAPDERS